MPESMVDPRKSKQKGTYSGIPLGHNKKGILSFATVWMDLEDMMLTEISQTKTNTL